MFTSLSDVIEYEIAPISSLCIGKSVGSFT